MKNIIYLLFLISFSITAQTKYFTKTGTVNFEASVPSFEEVRASHNVVTAIINTDNGELAALALVKGFRFKNALMEEHFNENYAESDTYPKATFRGKISNFSLDKLNKEKQKFIINGQLTFHGKTKQLDNTTVEIAINDDIIIISGSFTASASEFDIDIPKVVRSKIASNIDVSFSFNLKKK
ncbi:YceI family protein [Jejuia spongiicola]|uniref:YceI family protein n=1 Tax=Jejuia spongiicola TaxID=2942207 RepID=A0ABT0QC05_9FLAO|nr:MULTISPECIES: YceI family protein [Flavobacteriaceae]MCL6294429.1 YceI family protein [Jejuia spongiicola]PIA79385.1 hypothetical protein BFR04_00600 [Gaetbulibacter sp. 4G1]